MICGIPVMVFLVDVVCGNRGRAFCARGECRCRPVVISVCSAALAAASAAAAMPGRDVAAVTWDQVIDRIA